MSRIVRPPISAALLVALLAGVPVTATAQQMQMVPRPTPDADALADAMRRLGANPRDLASLIEAGELSLKLGDVNAAAALFKRAEGVDPMNGRVKAGMARILVSQQRPGEALRYFDQATGYGLDPRSFVGDRALAYDLIGEQERAQRDYRAALKQAANDEVERRYALSLGISGKREQALELIDAQLRKNDRSAWRTRAFVLAMTGDVPGAEKIANTMMPPGMGAALAPFFGRLAALPATDRAFAVHFGELRATPQRLADARMAPPLPVLPPEAPVQVAAAQAPAAAKPEKLSASEMRRRVREQEKRRRALARAEALAARSGKAKPPVALASVAPDPGAGLQPPRYGNGVAYAPAKEVVQALPATAPGGSAATVAQTPSANMTSSDRARVAAAEAWRPAGAPPRTATPSLASTAAVARPDLEPWKPAGAAGTPSAGPATPSSTPSSVARPDLTPWRPAGAGATTGSTAASAAARAGTPAELVDVGATPPASVTTPPAASAVARADAQPWRAGAAVAQPASPASLGAGTRAIEAATPPATSVAARAAAVVPTGAVAVGANSDAAPRPGFSTGPDIPAAAMATPVPTRMSEDSILAKIMAGISIPGDELGVAPVRPPAPPAPAPGTTIATAESVAAAELARKAAAAERAAQEAAETQPVRVATTTEPATARTIATKPVMPKADPRKVEEPAEAGTKPAIKGKALARAGVDENEAADPKKVDGKPAAKGKALAKGEVTEKEPVDPKKLAADRKAAAAKKLADAKKAEAVKKAAEEAKAAKANPPRIWVQVAGGANEGDLHKAWTATQAKAAALKGKAAYSTPLRATNRVVTGPFKTDAEARAFVNTLAKQGVSAFPFTSEKGQKMTKLGGK